MRILYLDCFSGISGDMTVGALTDLGITPSTFEWELSKLNLEDCHLHFERQTRGGIAGVKFDVHSGATHEPSPDETHLPGDTDQAPAESGDAYDHPHHDDHGYHHREHHHHEHQEHDHHGHDHHGHQSQPSRSYSEI